MIDYKVDCFDGITKTAYKDLTNSDCQMNLLNSSNIEI